MVYPDLQWDGMGQRAKNCVSYHLISQSRLELLDRDSIAAADCSDPFASNLMLGRSTFLPWKRTSRGNVVLTHTKNLCSDPILAIPDQVALFEDGNQDAHGGATHRLLYTYAFPLRAPSHQ